MGAPSEDAWTFDTTGLLHLPSVLSEAEIAHARAQLAARSSSSSAADVAAAAPALRVHPTLLACLPELSCGELRYRLDHPPRLLPPPPPPQRGAAGWLNSDAVEDVRRLAYHIGPSAAATEGSGSVRRARVGGFRILWVLDDT
eukprot:SAG25_NODE_3630_length_1018_cov_1.200218_2_plen_142_part_01